MPPAANADRRERARPLAPDERREAIVAATLPLLLEHGRATTTRQIAEAAGIAEGTVFRVFDSKDALFDAVVESEMDSSVFLAALATIDRDQPLRERLLELTDLLQRRFQAIFRLMIAMALPGPPEKSRRQSGRQEATDLILALLDDDADHLRVPPEEMVRVLRLLTFAGTHPHLTEGRPLTPEQIVDTILYGTLPDRKDLP